MKKSYPYYLMVFVFVWIILPKGAYSQFTTALNIPDTLQSAEITLYADIEDHDFGVGFLGIPTYAYNHSASGTNTFLGPTLIWKKGRTQTTHIINRLGGTNTTTVHWHGANIPANTDGGPHQIITPGDTFSPSFPVIDPPANLWYHPHAEDKTYTQVQMGLAGMIIVKEDQDPIDLMMPHSYGTDDFPLIIQDLKITADSIDTLQAKPRIAIMNGTIQPKLDVPPQLVRFRILDGSTRNAYMLAFVFDTASTTPADRIDFSLVASDGGYLPDSVRTVDSLLTSVGIRNEILFDFSTMAGQELYLINLPNSLTPATVGAPPGAPANKAMLRIDVGTVQTLPLGVVPPSLPPIAPLGPPVKTRIINFNGKGGTQVDSLKFSINNRQYENNVINDTVMFNTVEDWVIVNNTPIAHPFHIHLIQFYVQSVTDLAGNLLPMPVEYLGPKDDILVQPSQKVTFRAIFNTYSSPRPFDTENDTYMYHCHILTHEDGYYALGSSPPTPTVTQRQHWGMMQQFVVWDGTVSNDFSQPLGEGMTLFPNPAMEEIKLNGECTKLSTLRVYDLQGKLLMEKWLPPFKGTTDIDVSQLQAGLVMVEWTSPEGRFVKKLVISR